MLLMIDNHPWYLLLSEVSLQSCATGYKINRLVVISGEIAKKDLE